MAAPLLYNIVTDNTLDKMKNLIRHTLLPVVLLFCFGLGEASAQLNKNFFYYRGRDYIVAGRFRDAIESLNLLLRTEPKEYEGYFLRGVAKYNLDDLGGALSDFSRSLDENPAYTQAYQYRAITRSRMGSYADALNDFQKAIALRPNKPSAYYSRGVTYFLNRQFEKAVNDFSTFLRIEPREVEGYVSRGTAHLYMSDTTAALNDYNKAITVNPYWSDAYLRRGLLSLMRTNYADCVKDLDRAARLDSTSAMTYFYRAVAKNNMDNIDGSLGDFDKSIACDSTSSLAYFNRAVVRSSIGDYNRAIDDYNKVAASNPHNVMVFYNRASVYATLGDYRKALKDYNRCLELYPDFINAYRFRSRIKHHLGDTQGALADDRTANHKIKEFRAQMDRESYADTSARFDRVLSQDANFGNQEFLTIKPQVHEAIRLIPMFRFTITAPDTVINYAQKRYDNRRLDKFLSESFIHGLRLTTSPSAYSEATVDYLDKQNETPQTWNQIFSKAITQSLLSQYSSSMSYWTYAIQERPDDPFALISRAVTNAEMIDFVASLEGNYQAVNIDDDPATRLRGGQQRRTYDYSEAMADLDKAADLMPELPHIYYNKGNLLATQGKLPEAIQAYNKAIQLFPYFSEAYFNRGLIQLRLKESTTACMDISRAGELGIDKAYEVIRRYCTDNNKTQKND